MLIKNYKKLSRTNLRRKALQIINSGLLAIKTEKIIKNNIKLKGNSLIIKNIKFDLNNYKRIFVIGFGKASSLMAKELKNILKNRINNGLVISTKKIKLNKIKIIKGTHPLPTEKNIYATKKMINLLKSLNKDDLVISLISGGGSALLFYPNIKYYKYMEIFNKAFKSGIGIYGLNKLRKKYSNVKGGKLARHTKARIISLIFSDVVGDDLATIASGPTYGKGLKNVDNILLLNNEVALDAMKKKSVLLGLKPIIVTNKLKGEARLIRKNLLKSVNKYKNKNCFLFAGETTVTVKGNGKGGRNQELCLGAIKEVGKLKDTVIAFVGTDGIDGPTDAAGAIVDSNSLEKARKLGLDPTEYLDKNDSYNFFKRIKDLVFTGATGSNVADIGLIVKK
jgi:hydroxypyruvate reductase/glycerate 2-kinase